jgi:hypothetical protein
MWNIFRSIPIQARQNPTTQKNFRPFSLLLRLNNFVDSGYSPYCSVTKQTMDRLGDHEL